MNNYNNTFSTDISKDHISTKGLPNIFRLLSISHKVLADNLYMHSAKIFHEKQEMSVAWINEEQQYDLTVGMLVTAQWSSKLISNVGQVLINTLTPNTQPTASLNIFETVPHKWVPVPAIIKYAKTTFADLPAGFRLLFNAIFWEGNRFYRYLLTPNSVNQQFSWHHGNIMHAIVVAKSAKALAKGTSRESLAIMTLAALLNDAGKADDYVLNDNGNQYKPSNRMQLVGCKITIIEWISAAIAKYDISISNDQYLLLLHTLLATADNKPPAFAKGISDEYKILSKAQKFSIEYANIHNRPKYIDQGIKVSIEYSYFSNL